MRSLWSPDGDGRASRFAARPSAAGQPAGGTGTVRSWVPRGESEGDLLSGLGGGQCVVEQRPPPPPPASTPSP